MLPGLFDTIEMNQFPCEDLQLTWRSKMKAMVLNKICFLQENRSPLTMTELPQPVPEPGEVLLKVSACGVCHTELDEIEGRTPPRHLPVILGHQVVGRVVAMGSRVENVSQGDRLGLGWIFSACGKCEYCLAGYENLCPDFLASGRDANGGYAEYMVAPAAFCYPIPAFYSDVEAAPLLCAGAIGYRSLNLASIQDGETLGLLGFGSSAHLVLKMAAWRYPNSKVFVLTRSQSEQDFARHLGADWAGNLGDTPPALMKAIIDTTPAWKPILEGLECLKPGGRLVINAIRKESFDQDCLQQLDYPKHLWMEKEIKSVANVTRADIMQFLELAAEAAIQPELQTFALEDANQALAELKDRNIRGAKVLTLE
jgi:propanol-preferring alcohol dehydrogenase